MKLDLQHVWQTAVGALALQSAGGIPSTQHNPTKDMQAARRLLNVPVSPPTTALSVAPAQSGLPPMLALNGTTTALVGFNVYPPGSNGGCALAPPDFDAALDYVQTSAGANVIRAWAFQSMNPEGDWSSLDQAVASTQARGMALVVPLANQWGDCEPLIDGMRRFKNVTWYDTGYKQVMQGDTIAYRDYVQQFATRYAHYKHVHAQLINEANAGVLRFPLSDDSDWRCDDENESAQILSAFTSDMVGVIHEKAPNMLVALGTRGELDDCGISTDEHFQNIAALTDVCEVHSYDMSFTTVARRLTSCQAAGRPTLMGESAALMSDDVDLASAQQAQAQVLYDCAQNYSNGGLGGTLFWHYTPSQVSTDFFSLGQGHPLYAMVGADDKTAMASMSANFEKFSALAQQLTPPLPPPPPPPSPPPPAPPAPPIYSPNPTDLTTPLNLAADLSYEVQGFQFTWQCAQDQTTRRQDVPGGAQADDGCYLSSKNDQQWLGYCLDFNKRIIPITLPDCPSMPD